MKTLTVSVILALNPCYSESRVRELFGDRETVTVLEVAQAEISPDDRVWLLLQPGVLPADVRTDATARIVTRAVTSHALHCGNTAVEEWARGWLDGTDRSQAAAWAAARAAAWDAARAAAESAWDAARAAAWDAARAAWDAARAASESAAWAAAERQMQVADIVAAISAAEVAQAEAEAEVKARIKGLAAAGYCDRLAVRRLLADLRGQPGCERIQERTLNNYLAGRSRMPLAVGKGLDALIERGSKQ